MRAQTIAKYMHANATHTAACNCQSRVLPVRTRTRHCRWTNWARRFLLWELACYCAWLVAYTCFTLIFQQVLACDAR